MNSMNILDEAIQQMNEAFEFQDPELLDTIFEIEGKKLYADKLRLSVVSLTFKSMLSNKWHQNTNEAIKITGYKFEDFKELLTYIYSDMAEFYQIHHLKNLCDKYLSKMRIDLDNKLDLYEISGKYSMMTKLKAVVKNFIFENFIKLIYSDTFLKADRLVVEEYINMKFNVKKPEEFFKAVYRWSEFQAIKKHNESNDKNFDKNDAIKNEIATFLPYFDLKAMDKKFLNPFLGDKRFLFTDDELKDITDVSNNQFVKVNITNTYGQSLSGLLPCDSDAVEIIKTLKNRLCDFPIWWRTRNKVPSFPSPLFINPEVEWYLIYFSNGDIGVKKCHKESNTILLYPYGSVSDIQIEEE